MSGYCQQIIYISIHFRFLGLGDKMPFCSNCGAQVVPGIRFCSNCGQPIQKPTRKKLKKIPNLIVYPQPPPRPESNIDRRTKYIIVISLLITAFLMISIYYARLDISDNENLPKNRGMSIQNYDEYEYLDIEIRVNGELDATFTLESLEQKFIFDEYRDGDRVRVSSTNYPEIKKTVTIDGSDIAVIIDKINDAWYIHIENMEL